MLEKTVAIGDKQVKFRSSASVPRLYRIKFKRDIFKDLARLEKSFRENGGEDGSMMEIDDLEIFENVAYIMAFHADPTIPSTIDEWLEQFEMFSIYWSSLRCFPSIRYFLKFWICGARISSPMFSLKKT